eukprot:EG_transcript_2824
MLTGNRAPASRLVVLTSLCAIGSGCVIRLWQHRRRQARLLPPYVHDRRHSERAAPPLPPRRKLLGNLVALLRVVIPGVQTREFGLLCLHTLFLLGRTGLSIWVAKLDGMIGMAIVDRSAEAFARNMLKWLAVAIPATFTNAMLRYLEGLMALAFRRRLVTLAHERYMSDDIYYQVIHRDSRLPNPDQIMTEGITDFCNGLAHLYANLSKPIFDVVILSAELLAMAITRSGYSRLWQPLVGGSLCVWVTGTLLKVLSPNFSALVAERTARDGALRYVHSRIINYSEEIAFYKGHPAELEHLEATFAALAAQITVYLTDSMWYTMVQQLLTKYLWSMCGFLLIASVLFSQEYLQHELGSQRGGATDSRGVRAADMMTSRSLLRSLADACERIMSSGKDIAELAGHAAQLTEMFQVFEEVRQGRYKKEEALPLEELMELSLTASFVREQTFVPVMMSRDDIDFIKLEDVSLGTPAGQCLARHISLEVRRGQHLLITGPNGCGKSSLFRLLCELWPARSGRITKPSTKHLFYIPQRPYLPLGTLRDQVIYPHSLDRLQRAGHTDADLCRLLQLVSLEHILLREAEAGWEAVNDWQEVLSGGEKQRLGFARLMYHRPMFALLDESTSGVSPDIEAQIYQHCQTMGITMLSIAHRPSLLRFHTQVLAFDGQHRCTVTPLNSKSRPGTGVVHLFPMAAVLWQLSGRVVAVNAAAEALFGAPADQVFGQALGGLFPDDGPALQRAGNPYTTTVETVHLPPRQPLRMTSTVLDSLHLLSIFEPVSVPDGASDPTCP